MIDFLRGEVACVETDYIVMDVGGVGYQVFVANPYAFHPRLGSSMTVYIHHQVREDAMLLFGFEHREEQALFRKLIEVSGIGPKVAIGVLAGGRPEAVIAAIQQENITFLTKLPGIGKKTAQRMILDLKDKLGAIPVQGGKTALSLEDLGYAQKTGDDSVWSETKQALMSLGYTEAECDRALAAVRSNSDQEWSAVDALMKAALRVLYQG